MPDRTFELRAGGDLVGKLLEYGIDFPWVLCRFVPSPSYSDYRELFERDLQCLNSDGWSDDCDKISSEIQERLTLLHPEDPQLIDQYLLHIDGDEAWFRFTGKSEN